MSEEIERIIRLHNANRIVPLHKDEENQLKESLLPCPKSKEHYWQEYLSCSDVEQCLNCKKKRPMLTRWVGDLKNKKGGDMKVLFLPIGQGKTYQAIKYAHENDAVILTFSKSEAKRVYDTAMKMKLPIMMPVTINDNLHGFKRPIVVDNADLILQILLQEKGISNIQMMTINDPDFSKIKG